MMNIELAVDSSDPACKEPWDFTLWPNYRTALSITTIDAADLSEKEFYRNYVLRNRPCVVRNAVVHWPAFKNWPSIDYLKNKIPDNSVSARMYPMLEYPVTDDMPQAAVEKRRLASPVDLSFHTFLNRASNEDRQLVLHSISLGHESPLAGLGEDVGNFKFLANPAKPRGYVPLRAFFYRNSYTDWHAHPADETLMTQVVGDKEVLLLPPTDQVWNTLVPILRKHGYLYGINLNEFPEAAALRPFKAVVKAGDALYIPVYWWHAVASADKRFGVTVASTFGSPFSAAGDMRSPRARQLMLELLRSRYFLLAVGAIASSYAVRLMSLFSRRA